ncbi:MAG: phosphonoacetaldehyde reductase [Desulfobacterales bacterium]|nr:phosphonoacetaldehyde reductase [Desulfobacterales bacterium]
MSNWQYNNPVKIHFGQGIIKNLPDLVGSNSSVLITTPGSTKRGISDSLKKMLGNSLVNIFDDVNPNPTFVSVKAVFNELQQCEYDTIIALGGGSTIDTAKAVAAIGMSNNENWIDDHLKHDVSFPKQFNQKPIIAIPTTAGTGSEVTMWGTVWDMEEKQKYSISHSSLYPKQAILDPELTVTLPEKETIYSGLDALSHAMESIWNKNHNPISDAFALKAISLVHNYLPELKKDLTNLDLRVYLLRASLFAGLAFSNTKTALAHSISYPLTAYFGLPHGLACSLPLSHLIEFNGTKNFERVKIMAESLGNNMNVESMRKSVILLFRKLGISTHLKDYGISENDIKKICESAISPGRADNNITKINQNDIMTLVKMMF